MNDDTSVVPIRHIRPMRAWIWIVMLTAFQTISVALNVDTGNGMQTKKSLLVSDSLRGNGMTTRKHVTSAVTITATRSEIERLTVPAAVTIVESDRYATQRGYGLDEAMSSIPGVLIQSRSGNQDVRVSIRGFGARGAGERSNAATTRGIRFLLNGIPLTEPDGRTSLDLVDLVAVTGIDVVRSNTSALWGNASGGVVSLSTMPVEEGASLTASSSAGSFGFMKSSLSYRMSNGDTKAYAVTSNTDFEGWRKHSSSTLFQSMAGIETRVGDATTLAVHVAAASNYFRIPGPLTLAQYNANPAQAQSDSTVYQPTYTARDERRFNRVGRIGVSLGHEFNTQQQLRVMMYAEPKLLQRSERNTFRDFTRYHVGGSAVYSHDVQLSSHIRSLILAGFDQSYQDGAILFYSLDPLTQSRGSTLRDNKREAAGTAGLFIHSTTTTDDGLTLLAGVRSDAVTYDYENFINKALGGTQTFSQLSPKLGLSYTVADNMSVYMNLAYGVEVPAGNETDPPAALGEDTVRAINSMLRPIQSRTVEAGWKHVFRSADGLVESAAFDCAVYHITTLNDLVPYRGGRFYMSAAETRRMGFEAGGSLRMHNGLSVLFSATLSSNVLHDYRFDSTFVNASLAGRFNDCSGNTMPGIPSLFASLRLGYDPLFLRGLHVESECRHVSAMFVNDVNTMQTDAYTVVDVSASYAVHIAKGFELKLVTRVNNLMDSKYMSSAWLNPDLSLKDKVPVFIEPGMARNLMGAAHLSFTL